MAPKSKKTSKAARAIKPPRVKIEARPSKPVFGMGTWIALALFAATIGAAFYMNRQAEERANATETPAAEETFVFDESVIVQAIEVADAKGNTTRIERNAENAWALSKPEEAEANQDESEAAATQIGALRIVTPIEDVDDPSTYGFDAPAYVITVEFEDGKTSVLKVGDKTPTESGYYALLDDEKAYVVTISGIDALNTLITAPPYLNTPTPSPTATSTPLPTETPGPTTEASSTPEATPTATP
ncbi:MAG: hypothetical protein KPEEDBHJ_01864 [Anaerolineales bacterium]|nr:hypothetical protein [Anaerolineales bacterium]